MTDGYGPVPFQGQNPLTEVTRAAQEELYALLLNHMQGTFGTESQIDMVAPNGETTPADLEAGMVVHLDANGAFVRGIGDNNLPYFAKPAGGYTGTPGDGNVYGDGILALPAVASYKLCTNNYATGQNSVLAANDALTCVESGDDLGRITHGIYYNDPICGVVARGVLEDYDKPGRDVVEFFTYWLPELDSWAGSSIA